MNLLIIVLAVCAVAWARPQGDVAGNGSAPAEISPVNPDSAASKAINAGSNAGEQLAFPGPVEPQNGQAGAESASVPEQIPQAAGNGSGPVPNSPVNPDSAALRPNNAGINAGEELAFPGPVQPQIGLAGAGRAPGPVPEQIPQAGSVSGSSDYSTGPQ